MSNLEVFSWLPRRNPQADVRFRVLRAQFGDGYEQVAQDGLNSRTESWPLSFFGSEAEIRPIKDFLDRHGTWRAFLWTAPLGEQLSYRASDYQLIPNGGGWYSISVTFTQRHVP
ncbi:phage tail protein [Achromobacter deleyi]|uniref:Phage tail protein n=1 Tax=Achromobacter deleyi TaxID=1353891 RepID=A0A7T4AZB5_9BURK|nr:phage tail protein [Achromobacter deleyi]QQB32833.1 phage tail protein [Achromobacter deleyi]